MRKFLRFAEQAFTVLYLILYSGGPLTVILSGGYSEGGERVVAEVDFSLVRLIFFVNYAITFVLLVARWKKVISLLRKDRLIWVLIAITLASFIWSEIPDKTISNSIALLGTSLFGLYLATRYSIKQQLQLMRWTFGLAIVLSLLFIIALPKYGIMGGIHAGALRGIYPHKNIFSKAMALSAIIFLLQATTVKNHRFFPWFGFSISLTLMILARSTSALLSTIVLLTTFPIYKTFRLRYYFMLPTVLAIIAIGGTCSLWLTANIEGVLGLFGKDLTLTGRTELWGGVGHD